MADFVAVLRKTLDGLNDTSAPMREKVYDRARATIASKLTAMNPPLAPLVVERQKRALEDAILEIEKGFGNAQRKNADPLGELEDVFASLRNPAPMAASGPVGARTPLDRPYQPAPAANRPVASALPARNSMPVAVPPPAAAPPAFDGYAVDADDFDEPFDDTRFGDEPRQSEPIALDTRRKRRGVGGLLVALVILALFAAGGYGLWLKRDVVRSTLAQYGITVPAIPGWTAEPESAVAEPPAKEETEIVAAPVPEPETPQPAAAAPAPVEMAEAEISKFTQKLNADGTEVDAGPATVAPIIGEGTSIAAATLPAEASGAPMASAEPPRDETQPGETQAPPPAATETPPDETPQPPAAEASPPPAADPVPPAVADAAPNAPVDVPAAPAADPVAPAAPAATTATAMPAATSAQSQSIPVGQRAIFYEERTNVAEASAEPGSIVWSAVQESPGNNLPPEPVIRGEATIPGKDVQLRITIRRNTDRTLPASHIVEMIFLTPQGFEGGGIENVLRLSLKGSEQEPGSPLLGIPAKIADGFFLIALNDTKQEIDSNLALLRSQSWIDVPVQYKNGRRALFTMEKGIPGAKVFDDALKAWQVATASAG